MKLFQKGLHSDDTASSDGSLDQDRATSVSVGTQTEDSGCGNGCTSIYINENMNIKDCLEVGHSDVESNSNSLDEKQKDKSCLHEEIPPEMEIEIGDESFDHSIYSEQSTMAEQGAWHKRKRVKVEETQNEEFVDAVNNNENILTDKSDDNFHKSGRQNTPSIEKSGESLNRKVDQAYSVKSSQPFMNLKNVSKIIIENPPHETGKDSSSPRRQILEIKVPGASSLLADSCTTTGSPSRQVSDTDSSLDDRAVDTGSPTSQIRVSTGFPGERSPKENTSLDEKHVTTGIPIDNSPVEMSLDITHDNTGIPRDHSPVESSLAENGVTTGVPKEQALNDITEIPQVTYTHVIHVDTAISSGNVNSSISSLGREVPAEYRILTYPEIEEVSLRECTTGSTEQGIYSMSTYSWDKTI